MDPPELPKAFPFARTPWDQLIRVHPSIFSVFVMIVLPFSVVPAAMIYYAGSSYRELFSAAIPMQRWQDAAGIFFLAELVTVPAMAALMRLACYANGVAANFRECFTLAALAPVPMWLASLILFLPNLAVCVLVGVLSLACSLVLTYRGMIALFRIHDHRQAMQMATLVTAAGLFAWLILMQIVLLD